MEASQPTAPRLRRREIGGETFYEFDHGDATFRFPEAEVNPSFAGSSAFTVFLGWPGPRVVRGYGQPDLRHFIHLVVRGSPSPFPAFGENHLESALRASGLVGPVRNETLGLLEYRRGSPAWALYISEDASYLGRDGFRPYAMCEPTPTKYWDNTRQCRVDQFLSRQISYYYTFSDALLPAWSTVDAGIRNFLLSRIVAKN